MLVQSGPLRIPSALLIVSAITRLPSLQSLLPAEPHLYWPSLHMIKKADTGKTKRATPPSTLSTIYRHHTPTRLSYSNDATEMAMDCVSVCEMETVMSLTPDFLAADSASPWR